MPQKNRATLLGYFRQGEMPTESNFADLIDSCVNFRDDSNRLADPEALQLYCSDQDRGQLAHYIYRPDPDSKPQQAWTLQLDTLQRNLGFHPGLNNLPAGLSGGQASAGGTVPVLTLAAEGRVGINCATPAYSLDLDGTLRCRGRVGAIRLAEKALADGHWHTISPPVSGFQGYEVVASTNGAEGAQAMLLHATALHTPQTLAALVRAQQQTLQDSLKQWFSWRHWLQVLGVISRPRYNPRQPDQAGIRCCHSYSRSRHFQLALRWHKSRLAEGAVLQIRTLMPVDPALEIDYQLTELVSHRVAGAGTE